MKLIKFKSYDSGAGRGHSYSGWNTGYEICNGNDHFLVNAPQGVFEGSPSINKTITCNGECNTSPNESFFPVRSEFGQKIRAITGYSGSTLKEWVASGLATPKQEYKVLRREYKDVLRGSSWAADHYSHAGSREERIKIVKEAIKVIVSIRERLKVAPRPDDVLCDFVYGDDLSSCEMFLARIKTMDINPI